MKKIGMAKEKRMDVFKIVAAVLHLGNVEIIDGSNGGAEVTPKGNPAINAAAELLGMDATQLIESITTRATKIPGEATLVKVRKLSICPFNILEESFDREKCHSCQRRSRKSSLREVIRPCVRLDQQIHTLRWLKLHRHS
jgi:hypothetical protein